MAIFIGSDANSLGCIAFDGTKVLATDDICTLFLSKYWGYQVCIHIYSIQTREAIRIISFEIAPITRLKPLKKYQYADNSSAFIMTFPIHREERVMKNLNSASYFYKRLTAFAFLAGSLMFSTPVFSKSSCDALHEESRVAWNAYMAMEMMCWGLESICSDAVLAKYETWAIANEAWKACEAG